MENLIIDYEWREWTDKVSGEVKRYRSFFVEFNGIKIPVRAADNTATQILNQAFDTLESLNKK